MKKEFKINELKLSLLTAMVKPENAHPNTDEMIREVIATTNSLFVLKHTYDTLRTHTNGMLELQSFDEFTQEDARQHDNDHLRWWLQHCIRSCYTLKIISKEVWKAALEHANGAMSNELQILVDQWEVIKASTGNWTALEGTRQANKTKAQEALHKVKKEDDLLENTRNKLIVYIDKTCVAKSLPDHIRSFRVAATKGLTDVWQIVRYYALLKDKYKNDVPVAFDNDLESMLQNMIQTRHMFSLDHPSIDTSIPIWDHPKPLPIGVDPEDK